MDRIVFHAVIVAQLLLVAWSAWLGCTCELGLLAALAGSVGMGLNAFGPCAWWLAGLSAVALALSLWHGYGRAELVGSLLVAATVPCLIGGGLGANLVTASVLRWATAAWFVLGVTVIWRRCGLRRLCRRVGASVDLGRGSAALSRGAIIATAAAPVLLLTLLAAVLRLEGIRPIRPAAGTFFAEISPSLSYLIPLVLVMMGLVGLALRERSAGYAFSAGLVGQLAVLLGYALSVVLHRRSLAAADLVVEIQLATIAAACWAIVWLIARRWASAWQENSPLMRLQLGMAAIGNVLFLVPAILLLALQLPLPDWAHEWIIAAGAWPGWLALALTVGAGAYRQYRVGRPAQPFAAGLVGMAALGLLAASVCTLWPGEPEWGYPVPFSPTMRAARCPKNWDSPPPVPRPGNSPSRARLPCSGQRCWARWRPAWPCSGATSIPSGPAGRSASSSPSAWVADSWPCGSASVFMSIFRAFW